MDKFVGFTCVIFNDSPKFFLHYQTLDGKRICREASIFEILKAINKLLEYLKVKSEASIINPDDRFRKDHEQDIGADSVSLENLNLN